MKFILNWPKCGLIRAHIGRGIINPKQIYIFSHHLLKHNMCDEDILLCYENSLLHQILIIVRLVRAVKQLKIELF